MRTRFSIIDSVLVSGFTLLLLAPLCVQIFLYSSEGENTLAENRILAKAPSLPKKSGDWLRFPAKFEAYYKDNFGLRTPVLSIAITLKRTLGISPNLLSRSGKERWMFLATQSLGDSLKKHSLLPEEDLEDFSQRMHRLNELLSEQGIMFVHFFAPEKQTIYPDYQLINASNSSPTRLEQISEKLEGSDFYVDVKKALIGERSSQPNTVLYHEIDSHWNCFGAYIAYREVVAKGLINRGLQPTLVADKDFVFRDVSYFDKTNIFSTDFWFASLGEQDSKFECLLENSPLLEMRLSDGTNIPNINGEIAPPEAALKNRALYRNWHSRNYRETNGLKAIIVRDSFASRLVPYFNRTFSEVVYVHHEALRKKGQLAELIKEFQPDVMIYEYAERNLKAPERLILRPIEHSLGGINTKGK